MSNDYFTLDTPISRHTRGRADDVNSRLLAIVAGFDKLPSRAALTQGRLTYAADTGSANAILAALSPALTGYADGTGLLIKAAASNTGAVTINVNGLGVRSVVNVDGDALASGDIVAGDYMHLICDETNARWVHIGHQRALLNAIVTAAQAARDAAAGSATAAAGSATSASTSLASFRAGFLGAYADDAAAEAGAAGFSITLADGMFYYKNTATKGLRLRDSGAWTNAAFDTNGALIAANNLSDITDPAAARANLGVSGGIDYAALTAFGA